MTFASTGTGHDLASLRARAAARLSQIGLPHGRLEAWRFANPAAITGRTWRAVTDERPAQSSSGSAA